MYFWSHLVSRLFEMACRRLHHIYTIIITGVIIHVFIWHPMLLMIVILDGQITI